MTEPQNYFDQLVEQVQQHSLAEGQRIVRKRLFGSPGATVNGNLFLVLHGSVLVCKLDAERLDQAFSLPGAAAWDPTGRGRPMKEWVSLPDSLVDYWQHFALAALEVVSALPAK